MQEGERRGLCGPCALQSGGERSLRQTCADCRACTGLPYQPEGLLCLISRTEAAAVPSLPASWKRARETIGILLFPSIR